MILSFAITNIDAAGQNPFESKLSGRKDYFPIVASLVGTQGNGTSFGTNSDSLIDQRKRYGALRNRRGIFEESRVGNKSAGRPLHF